MPPLCGGIGFGGQVCAAVAPGWLGAGGWAALAQGCAAGTTVWWGRVSGPPLWGGAGGGGGLATRPVALFGGYPYWRLSPS